MQPPDAWPHAGAARFASGEYSPAGSLRVRMALFFGGLLVAILALTAWLYTGQMTTVVREKATRQQQALVTLLADEIDAKVDSLRSRLEKLAASIGAEPMTDEQALRRHLRGFIEFQSDIGDVSVLAADGVIVADFPRIAGRVGTNMAAREHFTQLRERKVFTISKPGRDRFSGEPLVILLAPILAADGTFLGAIVSPMPLRSAAFLGNLMRPRAGSAGQTSLMNAEGVWIAHPVAERVLESVERGRHVAFDRALDGFEGSRELAGGRQAGPVIYTFKRAPATGWIVVGAYPVAELYAGLWRELGLLALIILVIALAGAAIAWFVTHRMLAPLATLRGALQRIAADPQAALPLPAGRADEIGALTGSFNNMLAARQLAETERALAYTEVSRSGVLFGLLYEKSPIALALLRPDGGFIRANPAFQRLTGYTEDELKRVAEPDIVAAEFAGASMAARATLLEQGALSPAETEYVTHEGLRAPVRVSGWRVDVDGAGDCIWWIAEDIGARKRMIEALKASESESRMLSAVASATSHAVFICDTGNRIEWVNQAFESMTGYAMAEVIGKMPGEVLTGPDTDPDTLAYIKQCNEARTPYKVELRNYARDGREIWVEVDGAPVFDHLGNFERFVKIQRDLTARRDAETALRVAQERLQRALEGANDAVWERDLTTNSFYASDRFAEMLGLAEGAAPRTLEQAIMLVHPDDLPAHKYHLVKLLAGAETVTWESRFRTGDGGYRWLRLRGKTVRDAAGRAIMTSGTASDVDAARHATEELRTLQIRYARAIDGSNDGIWELTLANEKFVTSPRYAEILGYPSEWSPGSRAKVRAQLHPDDLAPHMREVEFALASNATHSWDVRLRRAAGDFVWCRFRGRAEYAADGTPLVFSGTLSDIHAAKLAEEELWRHRDNLAHLVVERTAGLEAARLEAVNANRAKSEFLANMSHELRTPMHAIMSFASFGLEKAATAEREKLLHYFRSIRKGGDRLLVLLNDLLDLSKLEAGKMEMQVTPIAVSEVAAVAIAEADALARAAGITLTFAQRDAGRHGGIDGGQLRADLDEARFLQVLRNLLSNAIKFSPPGSTVAIECAAGAGATIELRVRDAGVGIPPAELEAVFDKFVQSSKTKTGAGGTGLGLAICRQIIAAHGGAIHAVNNPEPEHGATFVVRLPRSRVPAEATAALNEAA